MISSIRKRRRGSGERRTSKEEGREEEEFHFGETFPHMSIYNKSYPVIISHVKIINHVIGLNQSIEKKYRVQHPRSQIPGFHYWLVKIISLTAKPHFMCFLIYSIP